MEICARAARLVGLTCSTCWKSAMARLNSLRRSRASPRRYKAFSLFLSNSITWHGSTKHRRGGGHFGRTAKRKRRGSGGGRNGVQWAKQRQALASSPCCSSPQPASALSFAGSTTLGWGVRSGASLESCAAVPLRCRAPSPAKRPDAGTGPQPGGAALPNSGRWHDVMSIWATS